MSNFEDYVNSDGELQPEDVFEMVTIIPKRKIKLSAYLEDKDGERIPVSRVAENLTKYVEKHMKDEENTPVNSQLFPMINSMMTSAVPRLMGMGPSMFLLMASTSRIALSYFGLTVALFMRYIQQHDLKIVTEETKISDKQIEKYYEQEAEADRRFREAMGFADEPGEA